MLLRPKKNLITIIDIGSAKISALIARIYDGNISVLGFSCKPSFGVKNGLIVDIRKAVESIDSAISELETMSGESIDSAYVCISNLSISSHNLKFEILTGNGEIGDREIKAILDKGYENIKENEKLSALHCIPMEYTLDGTSGIVNPYGMYGNCLAVKLHMITAYKPLLINTASCLSRCHMSPMGYISSIYADGFACVPSDDKNLGVTLINIGGGMTSIGLYKDNNFIHIESIPIGGINITKDIACAFSLSIKAAEKIKILFASLYPVSDYNEMVEYEDIFEKDSEININELIPISKFDLYDVISARVDEIIDMVNEKLSKTKNNLHIFRKIILTGGTSKIDGIKERFAKKFNTTIAYGKQDKIRYSEFDLTDHGFSSIIGSVLLLNDHFYNNEEPIINKTVQTKGNFIKWIQKHF